MTLDPDAPSLAPKLAGKVARLRAVERADLPLLRSWRSDPATWSLTMGFRAPIMEAGDEAWFDDLGRRIGSDRVVFAVDDVEAGAFAGLTQITEIDTVSGTASFGMQLGPDSRGRGIGREALSLTIAYARDALNLRKLTLEVVAYNTPAERLYEEAGFELEGTLRRQYYLGGAYHDVKIMGLFLDDGS
jgi:RimJ/RimL family protein N-acetyltransferase